MIWSSLVVFVAMFALDFVWARYTYAMTDKRAVAAGVYAVGILLFAGTAQIGYTADLWLLFPAGLGAFAGTFLAVHQSKKLPQEK